RRPGRSAHRCAADERRACATRGSDHRKQRLARRVARARRRRMAHVAGSERWRGGGEGCMTVEEQVDESAEYRQYAIEENHPHVEPYYVPTGDEIPLFEAAFDSKIPVLLKGPTGCGKTRFVEYMAWKLGRPLTVVKDRGATDKAAGNGVTQALPLVTVACHEDLTASDLVGRYLLEG